MTSELDAPRVDQAVLILHTIYKSKMGRWYKNRKSFMDCPQGGAHEGAAHDGALGDGRAHHAGEQVRQRMV